MVRVRTPGGKQKVVYKKKIPGKAHCAKCGSELKGVVRGRVYEVRRTAKTKKRPERPYGGVLCTKCTKALFIEKAIKTYKEEQE